MCKFKSAIITKDSVFMPNYNSHTQMLEELGIEDSTNNAQRLFVRAELFPESGDTFTDASTWKYHVDQDMVPDWYVSPYDEQRMRETLNGWIKTRNGKYEGKSVQLSELKVGDTFLIGNVEYIVLDKTNEGVSCLTTDLINSDKQFDPNTNNFGKSAIYDYLNGGYYKYLADKVGSDNIVEHEVSLASDENDTAYGKVKAKVGLLTLEQYRKYQNIIPNADGWWWLASPVSYNGNVSSYGVFFVDSFGRVYCFCRCYYCGGGVRAFCIFKSSIFVSC